MLELTVVTHFVSLWLLHNKSEAVMIVIRFHWIHAYIVFLRIPPDYEGNLNPGLEWWTLSLQ